MPSAKQYASLLVWALLPLKWTWQYLYRCLNQMSHKVSTVFFTAYSLLLWYHLTSEAWHSEPGLSNLIWDASGFHSSQALKQLIQQINQSSSSFKTLNSLFRCLSAAMKKLAPSMGFPSEDWTPLGIISQSALFLYHPALTELPPFLWPSECLYLPASSVKGGRIITKDLLLPSGFLQEPAKIKRNTVAMQI